jgi:3-methyladenine DNA glycosylase/8-oxoguanine DNA glycosylase
MTRSATSPEEHLRNADGILGAIIDGVMRENGGTALTLAPNPAPTPLDPDIPTDHYCMFVRAIVSQNISIIASTAFYRRLSERSGGRPPKPHAHIFLIFHLHRPDVLPVGDLEIRRCVQLEYGLAGLPRPAELERIAQPWRPYRTLACLYLWQVAQGTPQASQA